MILNQLLESKGVNPRKTNGRTVEVHLGLATAKMASLQKKVQKTAEQQIHACIFSEVLKEPITKRDVFVTIPHLSICNIDKYKKVEDVKVGSTHRMDEKEYSAVGYSVFIGRYG